MNTAAWSLRAVALGAAFGMHDSSGEQGPVFTVVMGAVVLAVLWMAEIEDGTR